MTRLSGNTRMMIRAWSQPIVQLHHDERLAKLRLVGQSDESLHDATSIICEEHIICIHDELSQDIAS